MNKYLDHFVVARNTRASGTLDELALVIQLCRIGQFSWSFLPAAVRLPNLLPSSVFCGGTFSYYKSAMNMSLLEA